MLLRHAEQRLAVREGLPRQDRGTGEPANEGLQARLPTFQRPLPQILAIEGQQIEGPHVKLGGLR